MESRMTIMNRINSSLLQTISPPENLHIPTGIRNPKKTFYTRVLEKYEA
jgi:hypothetical protein